MAGPRLEINDGLGSRVVPIDKPVIAIGRRNENDLRLTGSDVSRDHAEILETEGGYLLKDRGSRYGTFVNGEQVSEKPLRHGDRIQFGRASGRGHISAMVSEVSPTKSRDSANSTGSARSVINPRIIAGLAYWNVRPPVSAASA